MVVRAKDLEINFLCGHWGPWKVLEQNSPNDLGCDRLAKGLDDDPSHLLGVALGRDSTDHWMKCVFPALPLCAFPQAWPLPKAAPIAPSRRSSKMTESHFFREALPEFLDQTQSLPFHSLLSSQRPQETWPGLYEKCKHV